MLTLSYAKDKFKAHPLQMGFLLIIGVLFYFLTIRIAVGDYYYVTNRNTFICSACFQRGFSVAFKTTKGSQPSFRYFCAKHRPPDSMLTRTSEQFYRSPSIIGTIVIPLCAYAITLGLVCRPRL